MPTYDFRSECGLRFEATTASWTSPNPACPHCGAPTRRIPGIGLLGGAAPPAGDRGAPASWEGTRRGDTEYIARWRRRLDERRRFEERHPEHVERRDAVAAHEGVFERAPLTYRELARRAGQVGSVAEARMQAAADRISAGTEDQP